MFNQLSRYSQRLLCMVAFCVFSAGVCAASNAEGGSKDAAEDPAKTANASAATAASDTTTTAMQGDATGAEGISAATSAEIDAVDAADVTADDPYETYNRHTFAFNDALDTHILQPIARFYNKIMPKPLNKGVHNFFLNLNSVSTIVDDALQANFYQMTNDMWRLGINSTVGIGGLFDVASRMDLKFYENDFGMTLSNWGWRKSNYLVLPFYGSYTVRDGFSLPFDFFLFSAYRYIEPRKLAYGIYAVSVVDWRAQALNYESLVDAAALDKYVFVRNAYLQRRAYQLDENRHLGLYDRESKFSGVNKYDSPAGPGADANIDESTNIGQPANTENTILGPNTGSVNEGSSVTDTSAVDKTVTAN